MKWRAAANAFCAVSVAGLVACGGGAKQADSPGTCPDGTVLKGADCVPSETPSQASDEPSSPPSRSTESGSSGHASTSSASSDAPSPGAGSRGSSGKTPYDKDSVEIELKRAARQIKANCGSATDENGSAPGPWGKTTANVTLGRNGHVKEVAIPAPYDGQPGGLCAANAFKKIQFPPYASSSDVVVEWDIELLKPKH